MTQIQFKFLCWAWN